MEHNLEVFLFVTGILVMTISGSESKEVLAAIGYSHEQISEVGWNMTPVIESMMEPILKGIVPEALICGSDIPIRPDKGSESHIFNP